MKKLLIIIPAMAFGVFFASRLMAAEPTFSEPIPVGSDRNQVVSGSRLKVDGTHLKFFRHPEAPAGAVNFVEDIVKVEGYTVPVSNLVTTPGLLPESKVEVKGKNDMLDSLGSRFPGATIDPIQGFCPQALRIVDDQGNVAYLALDCQAYEGNFTDHQLEVADIRNEARSGEIADLLPGIDPLVAGVLGSAHEGAPPYALDLYPATVRNVNRPFKWPFLNDAPDPGYEEVIAYGLADLKQGLVTAAYDPLWMRLLHEISMAIGGPSYVPIGFTIGADPNNPRVLELPYISPLIFFRKDNMAGRMRLSGYQTLQLPEQISVDALPPVGAGLDQWLAMLTRNLDRLFTIDNVFRILTTNFNPIDVQALDYGRGMQGIMVSNQATLADLDQRLIVAGIPFIDVDGRWHPLRDYLGTMSIFGGKPFFNPIDMPHSVVSYVIFWGPAQDREWAASASLEDMNPNSAFSPLAYALVGPGMFHTAVVGDMGPKGMEYTLMVPSGEAAKDNKYYMYKIDPVKGQHLSLKFPLDGPAKTTPLVLPEFYEIKTLGDFAPYGIASADLDQDGCGDIALTFSGKEMAALVDPFDNKPGQHVVFQAGNNDPRMFASRIKIYFGVRENDKCVYNEANAKELLPADDAQIAAVALADVDDDGKIDILAGDVVPLQIAEGKDIDKWTGYVYLYRMDGRTPIDLMPQKIRVGFGVDENGPLDLASSLRKADYLRDVAEGKEGIFGVAALAADYHAGHGSNLGAKSSLPLALPPFGCPREDNVEVASPIELAASALNNFSLERVFGDEPLLKEGDYLMPQRCVELTLCPVVNIKGKDVQLPFFDTQKCCQNMCDANGDGTVDWPFNACNVALQGIDPFIPPHPNYADIVAHYNAVCSDVPGWGQVQEPEEVEEPGWAELDEPQNCQTQGFEHLHIADPCCVQPGQSLERCCSHIMVEHNYCDPASPKYSDYQIFCSLCLKFRTYQGKNDDQADGKERTEFASAYRPDRVYSTDGRWIADKADLVPAQVQVDEPINRLDLERLPGLVGGGIVKPKEPLMAPRLPRGQLSLGSEMTAVLKITTCDRDGVIDPGEQCDTAGLSEDAVTQQCPETPDRGKPIACDMRDCTCAYQQAHCVDDPAAACTSDLDCAEGQICDVNCECRAAEIPVMAEAVPPDDCECRVETYSSNDIRDIIKRFNLENVQSPTGRMSDERIVEPEQEILCMCRIEDGAAPQMDAAELSLSLSGDPLPSVAGNIRPWMVVQTSGSEFLDINEMKYITVNPITKPYRILPVEMPAGQMVKSLILPDLSASADPDVLSLSEAPPMVSSSLVVLSTGAVVINNMIQHQALASGQLSSSQKAQAVEGTGPVVHLFRFRLPPDFAAFPGVEPYPELRPIEDRQFDWVKLKDALASRQAQGLPGIADAPWENNLNYQFTVLQDVYGEFGQPREPKVVKFAFFGAPPLLVAEGAGGCKGCYVTSAPATLGSVLPAIAVVLFATGGILIGRIRRRRR